MKEQSASIWPRTIFSLGLSCLWPMYLSAVPVFTLIESNVRSETHNRVFFEANQEAAFTNAFEKLIQYYFEPLGFYRVHSGLDLGLQLRLYETRELGDTWEGAIEPGLVFQQRFSLKGLPVFFRQKMLYRILDDSPNRRYFRFLAGVGVFKWKRFNLYVYDEVYLNFFHTGGIDIQRFFTYLKVDITERFSLDFFHGYFNFKSSRKAPFKPGHIFGFALTYSYEPDSLQLR